MDAIGYMDRAAALDDARAYKLRLLDALDVRRRHTVLDVGCGPGTDLLDLAATGAEWVIGLDADPLMVAEARNRTEEYPAIAVHLGDARRMPVADGMVDRARVDRVLHYVPDPEAVFAELRRVVKDDGVVVVAQPDWDTITVDPGDVRTNRKVREFVCDQVVANATVGRRVARLAEDAGFTVDPRITTPVFRDFAVADDILGLSRNADRAVRAGQLDADEAARWLHDLQRQRFLATFMLFTAVLRPGSR
ncbi:methyltransferase domain-containing protein [Saccharothrix sp. NPDC042600]|uniref:methyltransferase domain-containing protein n=1 Tax=Saccharothrix TaxID=2071 RepID=UPI0033FF9EE6